MKNLRKRNDSTSSSSQSSSSQSRSGSINSQSKVRKWNSKRSRSSSKEINVLPRRTEYVGTNSKDPRMVASRIFIGNLPTSAGLRREDVESIFKKYGRIIGLLLMSGYAFVQYDNEESAIKAKQEDGSIVKGCSIEVRVANEKKKSHNSTQSYKHLYHVPYTPAHPTGEFSGNFFPSIPIQRQPVMPLVPTDFYRSQPLTQFNNKPLPMPLDCEIILVDEAQEAYGEVVMKRLLAAGLSVESKVLPFDSNTLSMVELASCKGTLFAIIINEQNEIHGSITVNILHGSPQEHRNMPLDDALTLITRKFDKYMITKRERLTSVTSPTPKSFTLPGSNVVYLLNLLADGRFLTLRELDVLLEFINERRESLLKSEGLSMSEKGPTIISYEIGSKCEPLNGLQANDSARPGDAPQKSSFFDNPLVQKALNNLITTGPNPFKSASDNKSHSTETNSQNILFPSASNVSMFQHRDPQPYPRHIQDQLYHPNDHNDRGCNDETGDMSWMAYAGN